MMSKVIAVSCLEVEDSWVKDFSVVLPVFSSTTGTTTWALVDELDSMAVLLLLGVVEVDELGFGLS
jgi:hypothetical protein